MSVWSVSSNDVAPVCLLSVRDPARSWCLPVGRQSGPTCTAYICVLIPKTNQTERERVHLHRPVIYNDAPLLLPLDSPGSLVLLHNLSSLFICICMPSLCYFVYMRSKQCCSAMPRLGPNQCIAVGEKAPNACLAGATVAAVAAVGQLQWRTVSEQPSRQHSRQVIGFDCLSGG